MTVAQVVTVAGSTVSILETMLKPKYTLDQRKTVSFTVRDDTGTLSIQPGQPVTVTDSSAGLIFSGYVNDANATNLFPNSTNTIAVQCIDNKSLADRDYAKKDYVEEYAGDIACDLVTNYLSSKGVTAAFAMRRDTSANQFNQGTLTSVVGANTIDDGDLELAPAGTAISVIEDTTSVFATGTLSGVTATNNSLIQTSFNTVKIVGTNSITSAGNTYTYHKIWSGSYTVPAAPNSGFMIYDMFVLSGSPEIKIAIDFVCSDGTTWRDNATEFDAQDQKPHPATDLSGLADGKWYHREFGIQHFASKTISYVSVAIEGDKTGTYIGYFRNIFIANASRVSVQNIFVDATTALNTNQQLQNYGYSSTVVSVAKCYDSFGTRTSTSYSLDAAKISASTFLSWTATQTDTGGVSKRNGSYVGIAYSIDGGASYIACLNNNAPLPDFPAGLSVAGKSIQFAQELISNTQNPEDSPTLNSFSFTLSPGYNGTKVDSLTFVDSNSAWSGGTFTNTTNNSGPTLSLSGAIRNWDNADSSNQTLFGGTGAEIFTNNKTLVIGVDGAASPGLDAKCQNVFAGQFQDFTCEVDVLIGSWDAGIAYRTTNWGTGAGTYAFAAFVTPTAVYLSRGNNTTNSANNTPTTVHTTTVSLTAGNWHRLKVVTSGTTHTIYLDDVQMFSITDTNFNQSGYTGLIVHNGNVSAPTHRQAQFDNFGVAPVLSGTWLSPVISLNSLGTYAASDFYFADVSTDHNNCSLLAEYTINGGSTWTTISNPVSALHTFGGPLPGLSVGQSLVGVSIQFRFTLTTTTATAQPQVNAVVLKVLGGFSASGNRISPVLSLAGVAGPAGSTLVSWNGVQPTGTTIGVDTSLDAITWTSVGSGASGSAAIAGVAVQPAPTDDAFSTNTSSSYTSAARTGGVNATWVWDTTNNRVTVSGGTNALLLNSNISTSDIDLIADLDESDASGMVWRVQDVSNYYELAIFDSSSSAGSTNVLKLFKVVANARTQIGSNIAISFKRGTPYRTRVTMIGTAITVSFDGTTVLSTTDSSLAGPGQCGLSSQTGIARFYQLRIQPLTASVVSQNVYSRVRLSSTDPTITPQLEDLTLSVRSPDIQNGALIPVAAYSVLSGSTNTIAQDFDDLAKQSNLVWDIDQNKKFSMPTRNGVPSPWIASAIDVDTSNILVTGVSVETIADLYRNTQFLTGGTDTISFPETRVGDGVSRSWAMGYAIDSINNITVDGITKTIGVKNVDAGKDFYYQQGNNSITEDASGPLYDKTRTLAFSYNAIVSITVEMRNDAQIAAKAAVDGTDGIVALVEDVSSLGLTKAGIIQLGQGRLDQYTVIGRTTKFTTMRTGLAVGQILPIFLPRFGVINGQFLVTDVAPRWASLASGGLQPFYDVIATEGPIVGNYTRFLVTLAKG